MWCTRWFLPLIILPVPNAPPFFLAVFLLSLVMHARPCFYCMLLLTALFTSSCYWQPVPLDTPLTKPLGNATTFAEALIDSLASYNLTVTPINQTHQSITYAPAGAGAVVTAQPETAQNPDSAAVEPANSDASDIVEVWKGIRLADRCWCSLANPGGLFAPTDPSEWERRSVERAARRVKKRWDKKHQKEGEEGEDASTFDEAESTADGEPLKVKARLEFSEPQDLSSKGSFLARLNHLKNLLSQSPTVSPIWPRQTASSLNNETASTTPIVESPLPTSVDSSLPTPSSSLPPAPDLPLLRPYYDLRPYGLDITIDFSWHRS